MNILIVDDVQYCLILLEKILTSFGYTVTKTDSVSSALKKIESIQFDMVITDYSLPEYDGLMLKRACKSLLSNKANIKAPAFVMISGHLNAALEKTFRSEGFLDVMPKPCCKDRLESLFMAIGA